MEDVIKRLSYFGGLIRGKPPVLSPTLENFEILEHIQQPLEPVPGGFRILMHLGRIKQEELAITVAQQGVVKIAIEHGRRQNDAGLWMKQNCVYTLQLPSELRNKELHAEWSDDNYLLVQPVSSGSSAKSSHRETVLIPQQVHRLLKPTIEIHTLQNMLQEIRNKVHHALRCIRFDSLNVPAAESPIKIIIDENLLHQDTVKLDEAHYRLIYGNQCRYVPKDGELAENSGNVAEPLVEFENSRRDVVDGSLTSLREQIGRLAGISAEGKSAGSVDEQVRKLIGSLDGENAEASVDVTYAKVIVLLMEDRLKPKGIVSPGVELDRDTGEKMRELVVASPSAAEAEETKDLAEKREETASGVEQATASAGDPVKSKYSVDKRRHAQPPPAAAGGDPEETEEEFEECPSPEKKRRF